MMKRFQECNRLEKLYRRVRYQSVAFLRASWHYLKALVRRSTTPPRIVFKLIYAQWYDDAKWYYTLEEVRQRNKVKYGFDPFDVDEFIKNKFGSEEE